MSWSLTLFPGALALIGLSLPTPRRRKIGLAGALLVAFASGSVLAAGGPGAGMTSLPRDFAVGSGALWLLGLLLPALEAALALRAGEADPPARIGYGSLVAGGSGVGVWIAAPLLQRGGMVRIGLVAVALALGAWALAAIGRRGQLGQRLKRLDARLFSGPAPGAGVSGRRVRWIAGLHLVVALTAVAAPWLVLLLLAVPLAAVAGHVLERRLGRVSGAPWAVIAAMPPLLIAAYLLTHVGGGPGLGLHDLAEAPYSPAFERLTSLLLVVAAWPLLGLWPFHSRAAGPATGLAGGVLLARIAAPFLPSGLAHWQPLVYPAAALAVWHGAALRRGDLQLAALGLLGLGNSAPGAAAAGLWVLGAVAVIRALPSGAAGWSEAVRALVVPFLVVVLAAGLGAETFYTTMAAAGMLVGAWPFDRTPRSAAIAR